MRDFIRILFTVPKPLPEQKARDYNELVRDSRPSMTVHRSLIEGVIGLYNGLSASLARQLSYTTVRIEFIFSVLPFDSSKKEYLKA